VDLTPVAFSVSGLALYFAIRRFGFLDVVPVAREELVDTVDAGMVVLDGEDRIVDTNDAFREWFALPGRSPARGSKPPSSSTRTCGRR
jgi:PAS domain-containing protein